MNPDFVVGANVDTGSVGIVSFNFGTRCSPVCYLEHFTTQEHHDLFGSEIVESSRGTTGALPVRGNHFDPESHATRQMEAAQIGACTLNHPNVIGQAKH